MAQTETTRAKKAAGKSKSTSKAKKVTGTKKGKSSTYNKYMTAKLAELKEKNPTQEYKERMAEVQAAWKVENGTAKAVK